MKDLNTMLQFKVHKKSTHDIDHTTTKAATKTASASMDANTNTHQHEKSANSDTPVQQSEQIMEEPASFQSQEIKLGALVGEGSFSQVYEVSAFELDHGEDHQDSNDNPQKPPVHYSPLTRKKRQTMLQCQNQNTLGRCLGRCHKSRYVVKQLHSKLMRDPKAFRRAAKDMGTEMSILSKCHHPNIVTLRGIVQDATVELEDGRHESHSLVLDRLTETLDERIHAWNLLKLQTGPSFYRGPNNRKMITLKVNYGLQIASALKYLHDRNIIYRDLKPQNIGFEPKEREEDEDVLQLFDFGLARKLPHSKDGRRDELFQMSMVGTRRYMSPEVLAKCYNTKADAYSWAMVFFEMLTQTRPFDGIDRDEHKELVCHLGKRPKIYSYFGFPKVLQNLLRLSWAQMISQRLTMNEVCATLEAFLAGTISNNATLDTVASICATDTMDTSESTETISVSTVSSFHGDKAIHHSLCSMDVSERSHDRYRNQSSSAAPSARSTTSHVPIPDATDLSSMDGDDASNHGPEPNRDETTDTPNKHVSTCGRVFRSVRRKLVNCIKKFHNTTDTNPRA